MVDLQSPILYAHSGSPSSPTRKLFFKSENLDKNPNSKFVVSDLRSTKNNFNNNENSQNSDTIKSQFKFDTFNNDKNKNENSLNDTKIQFENSKNYKCKNQNYCSK